MKRKKSGFTLVEIMMSVMILSVLMIGVMSFYIQVGKGIYTSAQRLELGANIRKFTDEMVRNASRSNECILYISSAAADRDDISVDFLDRLVIDTDSDPIQHPAGNFVVFVYYQFPKVPAEPKHRIARIVGYFTLPGAALIGPVRKVEIIPGAVDSLLDVETVIEKNWTTPATGTQRTFTDFLFNVRGLALSETITTGYGSNPSLFYRNDTRAVTVSGQIFQSNANIVTRDWKSYTESFNFVVTPRS